MKPPILGVDPGKEGGAVLVALGVAPLEVLGAWHWRPSGAAWTLTDAHGAEVQAESLHGVGVAVAGVAAAVAPGGWRVVLEGLYLDSLAKASRILTLAESAGEVIGPLRSLGVIDRPNASHWRAKVLRLRRGTSADAAEAYAVRCVPVLARPPGLGALSDVGHVAEALALAYFGVVVEGRHGSVTVTEQGPCQGGTVQGAYRRTVGGEGT